VRSERDERSTDKPHHHDRHDHDDKHTKVANNTDINNVAALTEERSNKVS
jgi:hypothetical protein